MVRAVLLMCPICSAVRALKGPSTEHTKEALYTVTNAHLDEHTLKESSQAIRKHQTITESTELIVTEPNLERLPTTEWQPRADAWLPDGLPADNPSTEISDSTTESPPKPHAED